MFTGKGRCVVCSEEVGEDTMRAGILAGKGAPCPKEGCSGSCKPPIVFFGKDLPLNFKENYKKDMGECDLLIVMGTSLSVAHFSSLPDLVGDLVPRVLINMETVGTFKRGEGDGENYRGVVKEGTCDKGCEEFSSLIGWEKKEAGKKK